MVASTDVSLVALTAAMMVDTSVAELAVKWAAWWVGSMVGRMAAMLVVEWVVRMVVC